MTTALEVVVMPLFVPLLPVAFSDKELETPEDDDDDDGEIEAARL